MHINEYLRNLQDEMAEIREAVIHFELYRLLMNIISTKYYLFPVKYVWVHPEYSPTTGISVDLVVDADISGKIVHFLVIEVKRKTRFGLSPFSDEAKQQAMRYAEVLQAPYYAVTDGFSLLLFKYPDMEVGRYTIRLDEMIIEKFLRELSEYHLGRIEGLDLPAARPEERIKEIGGKFIETLREVFNSVSGVEGISVRERPSSEHRNFYIEVCGHGEILILGLNLNDREKSYVIVKFDRLKEMLGARYEEYISRLSEIPGFKWIKERQSERFGWKYIRDIVTVEPDCSEIEKKLKQWILEVKNASATPSRITCEKRV